MKCFDGDFDEHYNFGMATDPRIDCRGCQHYYITWDPHFPNGCRLFGFKSKTLPSITTWEATGAPCEHYIENKKRKDGTIPKQGS
jgi:hypothetical protein